MHSLSELAKEADEITILTAYYSSSFFYDFFSVIPEKSRNKCKISLILNGFAGFRLEEQLEDLENLESNLTTLNYKDIRMYLNTDTSLFHSKLYCFSSEDDAHWFIGSANASHSAFTQNEEILFHLTEAYPPFSAYLQNVINNSVPYKEIQNIDIDCMIKFWRTGLIYYKPNANIQFTFSRLKIPNWVKKQLTEIQNPPPYTNPGEPWGAFNIKLALDFEDEEEKLQARHNPWSIETCFGFWVPSVYMERLDEKIDEASAKKAMLFQEMSDKMEEIGEENILKQFSKYISGVNNNLDSIYGNFEWKENDRIIVKYDDEYYAGTISKVKKKSIDVIFDDGDTNTIKKDDNDIAGLGKKRNEKQVFQKKS
jgi:HKD family nuclease